MTSFAITFFLAGGMLLLALLMTSRMRLMSLVSLFRAQATLLALYALVEAITHADPQLIAMVVLIVGVKVVLIPQLLLRLARSSGSSDRLQAYARPTTLIFVGVLATICAFAVTYKIFAVGTAYVIVATAFSLVLIGIVLLVSRKDMFGQGIGFLVMENGIFTLGLAITGGMPLFVEIGVLFDLMAFFILIMLLVRRAEREYSSVATDYLRELTD